MMSSRKLHFNSGGEGRSYKSYLSTSDPASFGCLEFLLARGYQAAAGKGGSPVGHLHESSARVRCLVCAGREVDYLSAILQIGEEKHVFCNGVPESGPTAQEWPCLFPVYLSIHSEQTLNISWPAKDDSPPLCNWFWSPCVFPLTLTHSHQKV